MRHQRVKRNLKYEGQLERKHKLTIHRARSLRPDEIINDDRHLDSDEELTNAPPGGTRRIDDVIDTMFHRFAANRPASPREGLPRHVI